MGDAWPKQGRVACLVGFGLVVVGWCAPSLRFPALVVLAVVALAFVWFVVAGGLGRLLGTVVAATFLTENLRFDWRAIRWSVAALVALVAFVAVPAEWWRLVTILGAALAGGVAIGVIHRVRPGVFPRLSFPDIPVPTDLGDRWAAWRFRRTYPGTAAELGWDKDRRGSVDRMRVPALVEARRKAGTWTLVFVSRGDWDEARWETEAHAMRRILDGRFVHVSHQGRRTVLTVFTAPLPALNDFAFDPSQPRSDDGFLLGHDAGLREVRWRADDASAHGVIVGPPGAGKSFLVAALLLQAAATPGWEAVMLDGKQTRAWEWLRAYGVKVVRKDAEIRAYLAWLESERQRVEEAGAPEVTRLVVLDEARMVVGKRTGPKGKTNNESADLVADLTGLGRSAGLRLLLVIQRADVEEMGGGYVRNNLTLRLALGRLDSIGRQMIFNDRTVTDQELAVLDGTTGRMIVSGLRQGDADGHAVQAPKLMLGEPGGPTSTPSSTDQPIPGIAAPVTPGQSNDTVPRITRDVVLPLITDGGVERRVVASALGVSSKHTTLRSVIKDLETDGLVVVDRDGGVVVLRRVPDRVPVGA